MVLNRIENVLELEQPEEQHGFRPRKRIEEHLLTTNILLDKATAAGRTIWIVSLDLSKAFDRVHWPALWAALHDQGVSEHCIWLLQHIYDQQIGEVVGEWGRSRNFAITAGVKQGCVLSPRLFSATLEWALRSWKNASQGAGIDLGDGLPNLMELRFADDILLFANSGPEAAQLLDKLTLTLTLRLHVRRQPSLGRGNVRPKHQLVEQNFTKSSFNCIHNAGSCARLSHSPN